MDHGGGCNLIARESQRRSPSVLGVKPSGFRENQAELRIGEGVGRGQLDQQPGLGFNCCSSASEKISVRDVSTHDSVSNEI